LVHRTLRPAAVAIVLAVLGASAAPFRAAAQSAPPAATAAPAVAAPAAAPVPAAVPTPVATPLPTPPATPTPGLRRHNDEPPDAASPSAAPTSPAFATLDGTWEVQLQFIDRTEYSHFTLKQSGQTISGTWNVDKEAYPLDGTYDGRLFKFTVKQPTTTLQLSGYVETASDMVGTIVHEKGENSVFTASHRVPIKPLFGRRKTP
jgi:hypothetical protein